MAISRVLETAVCGLMACGLAGQAPKPETAHDFDCYIQSAEARLEGRKAFLLADSDAALKTQLVRAQKIPSIAPNGPNPHKVAKGQIYDWIGCMFIPGASMDRLIRMLQDYDHRPRYFAETIASSKLLCRTGEDRFRYTMRLKEPAAIDVESDVVWERVDTHRWQVRSYSTHASEPGKDHGYLRRLNSYWRFAEAENGIFVEGETITLSDEFGAMTRALGSMLLGINPEKSVRHSLAAMRESVLKPELEIAPPPAAPSACSDFVRPGGCKP